MVLTIEVDDLPGLDNIGLRLQVPPQRAPLVRRLLRQLFAEAIGQALGDNGGASVEVLR